MDIYFIILLDFHMLAGKYKINIEFAMLFKNSPGCWVDESKYLGDQAHKKGS